MQLTQTLSRAKQHQQQRAQLAKREGIIPIEFLRPLAKLLPRLQSPARPRPFREKCAWTAAMLLVYLVCCQIPLYGVSSSALSPDPFYRMRVLLASNRGTLMELGISPIVTSSLLMQFVMGMKWMKIDTQDKRGQELHQVRMCFAPRLFPTPPPSQDVQKLVGIAVSVGEATSYVLSGMYGEVAELGVLRCSLIIFQLCAASLCVLAMDDAMQKGYGVGSAVSLFVATQVCDAVVWNALSPVAVDYGRGPEFEGSIIAAAHMLLTRPSTRHAAAEALYRSHLPNLHSLVATALVLVCVIYMQGFRVDLPVQSTRVRGQSSTYPIKLFYTSSMPIVLQSAAVAHVYFVSQAVHRRYPDHFLTRGLGTWSAPESNGSALEPLGGLAYYMSPPRGMAAVGSDPLHAGLYVAFMLGSCAVLSRIWVGVSGASPNDVHQQLLRQNLRISGYRQDTMKKVLLRYIPIAATVGGLCVGALTVAADTLGAIGSGTGLLLTAITLHEYYALYRDAARKRSI